ncbi:hypothetical protein NEAUS07_2527 [Nematocida ausubeli]|nr:hypothetical protein NEAUS07_2527 [Nematocida ausubeli]
MEYGLAVICTYYILCILAVCITKHYLFMTGCFFVVHFLKRDTIARCFFSHSFSSVLPYSFDLLLSKNFITDLAFSGVRQSPKTSTNSSERLDGSICVYSGLISCTSKNPQFDSSIQKASICK